MFSILPRSVTVAFLVQALISTSAAQIPVADMFRVVPLASGLVDPMQIAVAGDGRVFIAERQGQLKVYDPVAEAASAAGSLSVSFPKEDGLLDWGRGFIHYAKLDAEGKPVSVLKFREGTSVKGPIDLKIGPDGALYLLNWGSTSYPHSSEGTLTRLEYTGPQEPVSVFRMGKGSRSMRSALVLPGALVDLPRGKDRVSAYDLKGARAWEYRRGRAGGVERVWIPGRIAGPLRLRFDR